MVEPTADRRATEAGDLGPHAPGPTALEAELEPRITRLEQLVAALELLLERFQGTSTAFGATVFDNLDDPAASHAVLSILVASTADARWDVNALRRAVRDLDITQDPEIERPLLTRLGALAGSAVELKARFEAYRGSIGHSTPPRSPNAEAQLHQVVALSGRALLDISEVVDRPREERPAALAASSVTAAGSAARVPARRRAPTALRVPAAWTLLQLARRRRNRLIAESAALAVVAIVVLGSVVDRGGAVPDTQLGAGSSSAVPGQTNGGVALGSFAPTGSLLPASSPEPGGTGPTATPRASSAAPGAPGPTPRPTPAPAPTQNATAATRFDDRITAAADSIDELLGSITTAVQGSDFAAAKAGAEDITATAQAERSWLVSHPPRTCYQPFHAAAMAAYAELITKAGTIAADADAGDDNAIHQDVASSHNDVASLRQAGNKAVAFCA